MDCGQQESQSAEGENRNMEDRFSISANKRDAGDIDAIHLFINVGATLILGTSHTSNLMCLLINVKRPTNEMRPIVGINYFG